MNKIENCKLGKQQKFEEIKQMAQRIIERHFLDEQDAWNIAVNFYNFVREKEEGANDKATKG